MKRRIVRYNGGTMSYKGCSEPTKLVEGRMYEVVDEIDKGWQTDYKLKGVRGWFNSVWFDEVNTYLAVTNEIPRVGELCECSRMEITGGIPNMVACRIGKVKKVQELGIGVYKVVTYNNIYIMQVA